MERRGGERGEEPRYASAGSEGDKRQSEGRVRLSGKRRGRIAGRHAGCIDVMADDYDDLIDYALKEARKLAKLPLEAYAQIKLELRQDALARIAAALSEDAEIANHWLPHHTRHQDTA